MELCVLLSSLLCILCMSMVMVDGFVTANDSDRLSLLAFKAEIQDPLGMLNSWNHSLHFCEWRGVNCSRRHPNRVTVLDLRSQSLEGFISPHIGNLSFLKTLILFNNSFNGEIPQQVDRLFRLQRLNLAFNHLEGKIPQNISHCTDLRSLRLHKNKLEGRIPDELGFLSKLTALVLDGNKLSGQIPPSLGNLSSLNDLWLSVNNLEGSIPSHLSRLTSLKALYLHFNNLSEYGIGGEVSTQGDVYSYGILLLEMFTGKRLIDGIFKDGLSLHSFCKMALPLRVLEIVDSCVMLEADNGDGDDHGVMNHNMEINRIQHIRREKMREILVSIIQIGVVCSFELPSDRISMNDVIEKLQVVKDLFIRVSM